MSNNIVKLIIELENRVKAQLKEIQAQMEQVQKQHNKLKMQCDNLIPQVWIKPKTLLIS